MATGAKSFQSYGILVVDMSKTARYCHCLLKLQRGAGYVKYYVHGRLYLHIAHQFCRIYHVICLVC